jgi:hypothetical protein
MQFSRLIVFQSCWEALLGVEAFEFSFRKRLRNSGFLNAYNKPHYKIKWYEK